MHPHAEVPQIILWALLLAISLGCSSQQQPGSLFAHPRRINMLKPATATTTTTTTTTTTPLPTSTGQRIEQQTGEVCIDQIDNEFRLNQSWQIDRCNQTCRCAFRDEPRDPFYETIYAPKLDAEVNSTLTEIRCTWPAQCLAKLSRFVSDPSICAEPQVRLPSAKELDSQDASSCACPQVECAATKMQLSAATVADPIPAPATTTTTTQPSPSSTPAATSVQQTASTAGVLANEFISERTADAGPSKGDLFQLGDDHHDNKLDSRPPCSRAYETDQVAAARLPLPWTDQMHQQMGALIQRYAWALLMALVVMTMLFVIISCLYLKKSSRVVAPITSYQSPYENPTFTKLVSYYANQPHVLLVNESNQNFSNAAMIAKQKNIELEKFKDHI